MIILFKWFDNNLMPKVQSLYNTFTWGSAIIGFAVDGLVIQHLGNYVFITVGLLIAITGLLILKLIKA